MTYQFDPGNLLTVRLHFEIVHDQREDGDQQQRDAHREDHSVHRPLDATVYQKENGDQIAQLKKLENYLTR